MPIFNESKPATASAVRASFFLAGRRLGRFTRYSRSRGFTTAPRLTPAPSWCSRRGSGRGRDRGRTGVADRSRRMAAAAEPLLSCSAWTVRASRRLSGSQHDSHACTSRDRPGAGRGGCRSPLCKKLVSVEMGGRVKPAADDDDDDDDDNGDDDDRWPFRGVPGNWEPGALMMGGRVAGCCGGDKGTDGTTSALPSSDVDRRSGDGR